MRRALRRLIVGAALLGAAAPAWAETTAYFVDTGVAFSARGFSPFPAMPSNASWHIPFPKLSLLNETMYVEVGGLGVVTGLLEGIFQLSNVLGQAGKGWVEGINATVAFTAIAPWLYVGAHLRFDHLRAGMNQPMTNAGLCAIVGGVFASPKPAWLYASYEAHFGHGLFIGNGIVAGASVTVRATPIVIQKIPVLGVYARYGVNIVRPSIEFGTPFIGTTTEVGVTLGGGDQLRSSNDS